MPTIQSVTTTPGDPNEVTIDVGEALDPRTAQDVANYTILDGITISGATLGSGGREVTLATSTLTEDFTFTLTVDNVEDLAGNVIPPNTQITFALGSHPTRTRLAIGFWMRGRDVDGGRLR